MWASTLFYSGVLATAGGVVLAIRSLRRRHAALGRRGLLVAGVGALLSGVSLILPTREHSARRDGTMLDELVPEWQFDERHSRRIAAPPERVFEAIRQVRVDEIALFQTLTWIRRGGRDLPPSILNAGTDAPMIDIAIAGGFLRLADVPPRELVLGTAVIVPAGRSVSPDLFRRPPPPGFALAAMSFLVTPDDSGGSIVSTETRVAAGDASTRRRFAAYWRTIYPGSALIRRMWLRAIDRRVRGTRM
jgi:hypothetical protein